MVLKLQDGIVYGPISSRRLGKSLGINLSLFPYKCCNFNCVYCQYGRTEEFCHPDDDRDYLSVDRISSEVAKYLAGIGEPRQYIDYITFSGNGEPTIHPDFPAIVDSIITIRDEMVPNVPIALLSNGSMLIKEEVRKAVSKLDLPIFKLDVGSEDLFKRLNRPAEFVDFEAIIDGLKYASDFVIQSLFFYSEGVENTDDNNLSSYIEILKEIKPNGVQVYTIDRGTTEEGIKPASKKKLEKIVEMLKKQANINAVLY